MPATGIVISSESGSTYREAVWISSPGRNQELIVSADDRMEEKAPDIPSSSVLLSESTTIPTTLLPESSDFELTKGQTIYDKTDIPESSSVVQTDGDVIKLSRSLMESKDTNLDKTKDFEEVSSDPVPQGDDQHGQPYSHSETFTFSLQPDKGNAEDAVHSISSGGNDKNEYECSPTQTKKANPEENRDTDTISADKVPVKSVPTPTEADVQDDDLSPDHTTNEPTYPTSCDSGIPLKTSDQPDQDVSNCVIKPDILHSVSGKSNTVEEHGNDAVIPHITKTTAKFDNIFEAMTSDIEQSVPSDSGNLQEKSPEVINRTILSHDLQSDSGSNLVSKQKGEKSTETISLKDNAEQNYRNNASSTFKDCSLESDQAAISVISNTVISADFNQTNQSKFQSEESVLSEISKMCEQVNMAEDSDKSSPPAVSDSVPINVGDSDKSSPPAVSDSVPINVEASDVSNSVPINAERSDKSSPSDVSDSVPINAEGSDKPSPLDVSDSVPINAKRSDKSSPSDVSDSVPINAENSDKTSPPDVSDSLPINAEDSNGSNSQDVVIAPAAVNSSSEQQKCNKLSQIVNSNPEKPTDCSKTDNQYSLSSEAERQEEIMAMQRGIYGDELETNENSIQQPSKDDFSDPLQAVNNSSQQDEGTDSTPAKVKSPVMTIKEEPMDYEDYPTVVNHAKTNNNDNRQKSPETSATADVDPTDSSGLLMSEIMSLNSSQTLLELASKHLDSMSAEVGEESVVVENVGMTQYEILNSVQSVEKAKAESIDVTKRLKYKPPKIPLKLKECLTEGPFTCFGCGDSFLFKSSVYTHLNRKCLKILCKNEQCLNSSQETEFFSKCSYLIHCKEHNHKVEAKNVEVSCATDYMLHNITDMVELPSSQAFFSEFKSSLYFSWTCVECNVVFESAKALAAHFVPNSEGLQCYQCDICKKHLFTTCALTAHKRTHSEEKPFVCPECGQLFLGSWGAFSKHLNMKCFHTYRQPSLTCPKCSITGSSFEKMTQHLLCHKEVYLKCQKCPMAFKSPKNIQTHMGATHGITNESSSYGPVFKCSICDTVFHNLNHLTTHTSKHVEQFNITPKYNFKCWLCPNIFNNRIGLEKHLSKQHRIKPCKTLCDLCGLHLENLADLLTHFESKGCLKFPNSSSSLAGEATQRPREDGTVVQTAFEQIQQHPRPQKNKTKIKVKKTPVVSPDAGSYYKCGVCEFKCNKANISEINSHIRKHRADGIYLCSICLTAVFDTFNDLHSHQFLCRKKKADKKGSPSKDNSIDALTCQKCSANFLTDTELTEHMHTAHGIASQFPCHLCGLTYDTQHSLYQHIQLVHEGKKHLYLCWICQSKNVKRTFTTAPKLERHLVAKHRVPRNIIDPEKFPRLLPGLHQKDTIIDLAPEQDKEEGNKQGPIKRLKLADDTVFRCAKCEFSSENREEFEVHIKAHKAESTSRQCPECGLCFSVLPSLKKHLIMVHKIKDISTYVRTSGLDQAQHVEPPTFTKSPNSGSLSDIEVDNPLECRVCLKNCDSEISLKTHMRTHGMAFICSKRPSFPSQTPEVK